MGDPFTLAKRDQLSFYLKTSLFVSLTVSSAVKLKQSLLTARIIQIIKQFHQNNAVIVMINREILILLAPFLDVTKCPDQTCHAITLCNVVFSRIY